MSDWPKELRVYAVDEKPPSDVSAQTGSEQEGGKRREEGVSPR